MSGKGKTKKERRYADEIKRLRRVAQMGMVSYMHQDNAAEERYRVMYGAGFNKLPLSLRERQDELFIQPTIAVGQEHGPFGLIELAVRERWA